MNHIEAIMLFGCVETIILFLYAARYYMFALVIRLLKVETSGNPGKHNCDQPSSFVTVLLPLYNEPNVADRLMRACTSFNSPQYEVIVIDDSDDGVTSRKLEAWRNHPNVKVVHRHSRRGWKAGALNASLEYADPRSTHILVLDADFLPPSDLLKRFLAKFTDEVAAAQGYQRHDLNAEENWITKGIRVLFSVHNMVELNARNRLGLFPQLTGSVYMIRTDVLRKLRYEEDITEDWNLTLRLCEAGYKIVYDPTLAASAECPNTLRKLFRQQERWSEGHTRNFRRHFWSILRCGSLSLREKIDFLFVGGVYLNSILVVASTLGGLIALPLLGYVLSLPYVVGSIFLASVSVPSVVLASLVALSRDWGRNEYDKIPYALVLSYVTAPVAAYAALKGLVTNSGYFHRTYKTGKIIRKALANIKDCHVGK